MTQVTSENSAGLLNLLIDLLILTVFCVYIMYAESLITCFIINGTGDTSEIQVLFASKIVLMISLKKEQQGLLLL